MLSLPAAAVNRLSSELLSFTRWTPISPEGRLVEEGETEKGEDKGGKADMLEAGESHVHITDIAPSSLNIAGARSEDASE